VRQPKRVRTPTLKNGRPSMNIAIIGSTGYQEMMREHAEKLYVVGDEVRTPAFDCSQLNELGLIAYNRELIEWADEVHIFYDNRSSGTIFDFGMCFALRKPIKIIFLQPKTFANAMRQYEAECKVRT
jgi:nucleoside 2-deoxyribosyltransferase